MKIHLSVTTNDSESMTERNYLYEIEMPDATTLETVEAHAKSMLRVLDAQAHSTGGAEDDEDSEQWKQ